MDNKSTEVNTPESLARGVFSTRKAILLNTASKQFLALICKYNYFEQLDVLIQQIRSRPLDVGYFLADLIVAATRSWEAFTKENGQYRFRGWNEREEEVFIMLQDDFVRVKNAFNQDDSLQIKQLVGQDRQTLLDEVQSLILPNLNILKETVGQAGTENGVAQFFQQVQLYSFEHGSGISGLLNGLSSYDGSRIYFSFNFLLLNRHSQLVRLLEHESMHNLVRYLVHNHDPLFISPSKYPNLVTDDNQMIECGDYYELKVYKKVIDYPSPFCLQTPYMKKTM